MVEGWILDLYPFRSGEMVIWIKCRDGNCLRLVDSWRPSIYVTSDDFSDLEYLKEKEDLQPYIYRSDFERKIENITDFEPSNVLRLILKDAKMGERLAEKIKGMAAWGVHRIYNVDVLPAQSYCFEKNLFPLAYVRAEVKNGKVFWELLDDVKREDYELPPLRSAALKVKISTKIKIPNNDDSIETIILYHNGCETKISADSESEMIRELVRIISQLDPDIIFTDGGDQFLIPYLIRRAQANQISNEFILGREKTPLRLASNSGRSYFAYGRALYRHPTYRFLGRIHIDESNTSFYDHNRLEGLFEVARLSRIPLNTTVRASIGKALGGVQFYNASKDNILIPWKPSLSEHPKTIRNLVVADRGGFIFEPRIGVHSGVGELDFTSLYPAIMVSKNISAETIQCECCPDSSFLVPEVDYRICEKRLGIIPKSLELILRKRLKYKKMRDQATDPEAKAIYDSRQAALKWMLVCCFGYLGYRNAKFGRIDAHISVCAFARKILLDTVRIAELRGFKVIHGIVDSLWLQKRNTSAEDYDELCQEIESETGFRINFEGIYKWIAFLSSRIHDGVPVMNRYFGVFENGEVKVRGIESRRRDAPKIVSKCQDDMLTILSEASDADDVSNKIPRALDILKKYRDKIHNQEFPTEDFIITCSLSKNPSDYKMDIMQALAAQQLVEEGVRLSAGQKVQYIITDYRGKGHRRRTVAAQLADRNTKYDIKRYSELLIRGAASILKPFGFDEAKIENIININGVQSKLDENLLKLMN